MIRVSLIGWKFPRRRCHATAFRCSLPARGMRATANFTARAATKHFCLPTRATWPRQHEIFLLDVAFLRHAGCAGRLPDHHIIATYTYRHASLPLIISSPCFHTALRARSAQIRAQAAATLFLPLFLARLSYHYDRIEIAFALK